jgi:adenylate cyclase
MAESQRKKKRNAIIMAIILLSTMATISQSEWFGVLELKSVDARTRWLRKNLAAPNDIVLILIDEASLDSMQALFGRWPWPRRVFAEMIEFLSGCGAKALLIDILFTEKQQPSQSGALLSEDDQALASATENAGNVFHSAQFHQDREDEYNRSALNRPLPADFINRFALKHQSSRLFRSVNACYLPFKELYSAAAGVGVVSMTPDSDGVFRRTAPLIQYGRNLYPTLSIAPYLMSARLNLDPRGAITLAPSGAVSQNVRLPMDSSGNFFINMYGRYEAFSFSGTYVSLMKIRQGVLTDLPVAPEGGRS